MAQLPQTPEEKVEEMLQETFPASDAAAWGGGDAERARRTARQPSGPAVSLKGKTFAILASNGFEQSELMEPRRALLEAGASVEIVSLSKDAIRAWHSKDWGDLIEVDLDLNAASPARYDGLVLPGGTLNADHLRMEPRAICFVKDFFENRKPVAAICHAPWLLIEAGVVAGRRLSSWPSLKTDIRNAGGEWIDSEVVVDGQLVTSRKPDDLPAFNEAMISLFAESQRRASAKTAIGPTDV